MSLINLNYQGNGLFVIIHKTHFLNIILWCSCIVQMKWFSTQSDNMRAAVSILILALIQNSDATFFHQFTFSSGFWSNRIFQSVQWGKTNLECASICSIITEVITNLNLFFHFFTFVQLLITSFSVSFTYVIRRSRDAILVNFHYQPV